MSTRPSPPRFTTEQIAYWFFRINGCLNIANFLVHHEYRGHFGTDVDILAVRFPFRKELALSQKPMEDHPVFNLDNKIELIICEVKTGLCDLNGPWTDPARQNMHRVLYALGAFPDEQVPKVADALYQAQLYEDDFYVVRLFAVGVRRNPNLSNSVAQLAWDEVLTFIYDRFQRYRREKAQHDQWNRTGKELYAKMKQHRTAIGFVDDVMREMGL